MNWGYSKKAIRGIMMMITKRRWIMIQKRNLVFAAICVALALFSAACKVETDDGFEGDIAGAQTSGGHAAPENLKAAAGYSATNGNIINLSWDAVPGASSYKIYYAETVKGPYADRWYTKDASTSGWISGLTQYKTYYFKVTAVFNDGKESPFSAGDSAVAR
jgi:hypothetical protein